MNLKKIWARLQWAVTNYHLLAEFVTALKALRSEVRTAYADKKVTRAESMRVLGRTHDVLENETFSKLTQW
jgi:hypothetical protein